MKRIKIALKTLVVGALMMAALPVMADTYDIDASHSSVGFKIKHLAISNVNGTFSDFTGSFDFVPGKPEAWTAEATIQLNSVNTGDKKRDAHLLNEDFFDAEKYPTMDFKFVSVEMKDDEEGILNGTLTMHGVTNPVSLELEINGTVTDPWGSERAGFSAEGKINRKDWGLTYGKVLEGGGLMIGNDVKIYLEVEGVKRK
jgi:polyisoprenoid-binding protein YceI